MVHPPIVYWDANAFLALINDDKSPAEMQGVTGVWAAAQKGQTKIVTSTLTIAEVIHKKGAARLDPAHRPLINNFFRDFFIVLRPVTRQIAEMARDVVWDSAVKPKDAIHVATAAFDKIVWLHTFDGGMIAASGIVVQGLSMQCMKPIWHPQDEMDLKPQKALPLPPPHAGNGTAAIR